MLTIGFAGTAKNTGKTTAALHLLSRCEQRGLPVALTSIGYDGENLDNITGLPKPRYHVQPGTLVATAERCLPVGSAACRRVADTGIQTVLGAVILVEITAPGSVVLAGPNRGRDISVLLDLFRARQASLVFLDGALNRLVPLTVSDALVLSTGAAFDEDIARTAGHAGAAAALFRLPVDGEGQPGRGVQIQADGGSLIRRPGGSLLSHRTVADLLADLPARTARLTLPGACHPLFFEDLLASGESALAGCRFVFSSPFHLLAGGDPRHWQRIFARLPENGQSAAFLHTVPLRLVTVNPFYPRYLSSGRYQAGYVDKDELRRQIADCVAPVPVENVLEPARGDLLSLFPFETGEKNA